MTGKERLNTLLRKQPTDRLPWSMILDNHSISRYPEQYQKDHGLEFQRQAGCDIFLLNGWNTGLRLESPHLHFETARETVAVDQSENTRRVEWHTAQGVLVKILKRGHPIKHPVETKQELDIYTAMWESASFERRDDTEKIATIDALIGNHGVMTRFWGPSTIPRLLEQDMGIQNFYYLLHDHPDEMGHLIHCMHRKELDAFHILADGPWTSVTLIENTSTHYISPPVYAKYNMPHQRDFCRIVQGHGKTAILHMCGHIHAILDVIKETGCDGIHALTPPPLGDTTTDDVFEVLGEDTIIISGLGKTGSTRDEIRASLDRLITPRLRNANFVFNTGADGRYVSHEYLLHIADWMRDNGSLS